jgi:hypothetical protein
MERTENVPIKVPVVRLSAQDAEVWVTWRCALTQSIITAFIALISWLNFPATGRPLAIIRAVTIVWALGLLGIAVAERKDPRRSVALSVFGLVPVPLFPMFLLIAHERSIRELPLELLFRENVASVVYALATPPAATLSLVIIAAFTLQGLSLYWMGGYPIAVEAFRLGPWITVVVGAFATGIALYRAHWQRREVTMIEEAERMVSLKRLAQTLHAVRDFANTPLQTIRIALSILASRHPEDHALTGTMERSMDRLSDLSKILEAEEAKVDWKPGEESFDPVQVISKQISSRQTP